MLQVLTFPSEHVQRLLFFLFSFLFLYKIIDIVYTYYIGHIRLNYHFL